MRNPRPLRRYWQVLKHRPTKAEQRDIFWAVLRTMLGWGLDAEAAARSSIVYVGGMLIFSLGPLGLSISVLIDPPRTDQHSTDMALLIWGLVWLTVWIFPVGGCLRAWWVGRRGTQQRTKQLTGQIVFLHLLSATYLGNQPSMLFKLALPEGGSKLFLAGPRLTSRLRLGKTVLVEYVPTTELVLDIHASRPH